MRLLGYFITVFIGLFFMLHLWAYYTGIIDHIGYMIIMAICFTLSLYIDISNYKYYKKNKKLLEQLKRLESK